jgi:hypothetical protein
MKIPPDAQEPDLESVPQVMQANHDGRGYSHAQFHCNGWILLFQELLARIIWPFFMKTGFQAAYTAGSLYCRHIAKNMQLSFQCGDMFLGAGMALFWPINLLGHCLRLKSSRKPALLQNCYGLFQGSNIHLQIFLSFVRQAISIESG